MHSRHQSVENSRFSLQDCKKLLFCISYFPGKPQPLPPSDSDIIFNSFRPSAPPPRTSPSGQPEPTLNVPEPATEEEESAKQPEPTNKQPTAGNDDSNVAYGTAPAPNDSQESEMDYPANEAAVTTTEPKVQNAPEVVEEDIADAPVAVPSPAMEEKVKVAVSGGSGLSSVSSC